jgi:hypothetical protein
MLICPWNVTDNTWVRAKIDLLFQALALAGFLLALCLPGYRWITLTFLLVEFPPAFLYDRELVEPFRHTYAVWPLVLFAATLPLVVSGLVIARRFGPDGVWTIREGLLWPQSIGRDLGVDEILGTNRRPSEAAQQRQLPRVRHDVGERPL